MSAQRDAVDVGIGPGADEDESALGEDLHALIGRFTSSEDGKQRMNQAYRLERVNWR